MQVNVREHTQGQERLVLAPQAPSQEQDWISSQEGLAAIDCKLSSLRPSQPRRAMPLTLLPSWTGPPGADGRAPSQLFPLPNLVLLLREAILIWSFQRWLRHRGREMRQKSLAPCAEHQHFFQNKPHAQEKAEHQV